MFPLSGKETLFDLQARRRERDEGIESEVEDVPLSATSETTGGSVHSVMWRKLELEQEKVKEMGHVWHIWEDFSLNYCALYSFVPAAKEKHQKHATLSSWCKFGAVLGCHCLTWRIKASVCCQFGKYVREKANLRSERERNKSLTFNKHTAQFYIRYMNARLAWIGLRLFFWKLV